MIILYSKKKLLQILLNARNNKYSEIREQIEALEKAEREVLTAKLKNDYEHVESLKSDINNYFDNLIKDYPELEENFKSIFDGFKYLYPDIDFYAKVDNLSELREYVFSADTYSLENYVYYKHRASNEIIELRQQRDKSCEEFDKIIEYVENVDFANDKEVDDLFGWLKTWDIEFDIEDIKIDEINALVVVPDIDVNTLNGNAHIETREEKLIKQNGAR